MKKSKIGLDCEAIQPLPGPCTKKKALTEREVELHSELEDATSEASSLFAKIEHKSHIKEGNKMLIQSFQTLLTEHLEVLHNIIVSYVTQKEQQLNAVEEHMKSLATEQDKANEELQVRVKKMKDVVTGGIESLIELSTEFCVHSETAYSNVNSEVVKYSSALTELIREASVKVGDIINDLHSNLNDQEQSIASFWQHQQENYDSHPERTLEKEASRFGAQPSPPVARGRGRLPLSRTRGGRTGGQTHCSQGLVRQGMWHINATYKARWVDRQWSTKHCSLVTR